MEPWLMELDTIHENSFFQDIVEDVPLSAATIFVTPKAVFVVIWMGPRCLVGKPRTRSSDVRSLGGSSPTCG